MTKVEFHANEAYDWEIGIGMCQGEDENGQFIMTFIGIGFFSLHILKYQ